MPQITPPPKRAPRKPSLILPAGSVDSHVHMFGPLAQYPFAPDANYHSEDATAEMYFAIQDGLGLSKAVLVSGGGYGQTFDHLADTLRRHPARLRGVVRLPPQVSLADCEMLNKLGVKGARFFGPKRIAAMTPSLVDAVKAMNWHFQFYPEGDVLPEVADRLLALQATVVLDHFGHVTATDGVDSASCRKLFEMLDTGRVWVKLSAPMRITPEEHPYPSVTPIARYLTKRWPNRCVWATDWPHTLMWDRTMADDGDLVDLLSDWIEDSATLHKVMVDNPSALYGFLNP